MKDIIIVTASAAPTVSSITVNGVGDNIQHFYRANDENSIIRPSNALPIVIFHPGSRNLRFGRHTDTSPMTVMHAIGRRRKTQTGLVNTLRKDGLLPNDSDCIKLPPEVESARLQLCHTLQTASKSDGSCRFATQTQTVSGYNKLSKGQILGLGGPRWEEFSGQEHVFGDDILRLNPDGDFNVHFPWRRGELNVHENIGGSLSSVMEDISCIWRWCVTEKLRIPARDIKGYQAVVVIPVIFAKSHAKEILNMLLNTLGFSSAFLIQDHVCATFGAGLAVATVVDVGDQKISISCVEDGISLPRSRILLKYGGIDLTNSLLHFMKQSSVPFSIDRKSSWDIEFINTIKERLCHLNLNRCGSEEHVIVMAKPGARVITSYKTHFGDELLVVPLSYFNPDLLRGSIGAEPVVCYHPPSYIADDPFDDAYISETSRKVKETDDEDDDTDDGKADITQETTKIESDSLLGIDQAILQSIECSDANDEVKRRLYSCILVVGGGFKFQGLGLWLQNKLNITTPKVFKCDVDVTTVPKDQDPAVVAWKGATILVQLESSSELWISQDEWNTFGFRILREKSLCTF